ncbi:MAG: bifunctional tetrahydrofolate synthase/dihydrofolate synthase [Endozoicomonadaceae bacterium]|nr:bifunctional tetrahydrofolate synthase/dihydrofolate synthase [Endozoicomonadaceae bacterium]
MTFDSLSGWLAWLESQRPEHDMVLGLDRVGEVARRILPEKLAPKVVTIAGTNGKGTTVALLDALLKGAGKRVGAYTSPHLMRFNERVCINGEMVSDQSLCDAFEWVNTARNGTFLTYFEFVTLAALAIFSQRSLDVLLLEVGLGGRLDAVNLVEPDVAVVTTVALDHQQWLGHDIETIAAEKAGIYRSGKPAIFGDKVVPSSLLSVMRELGATPFLRCQAFDVERGCQGLIFKGVGINGEKLTLSGLVAPDLPLTSVACALQIIQLLSCELSVSVINAELQSVSIGGRMQKMSVNRRDGRSVPVILDVAHNPQAAHYLAECLQTLLPERRLTAVLAMLSDKDFAHVVNIFDGVFSEWHTAAVSYAPRALPAEALADHLLSRGERVQCHGSVADALDAALECNKEHNAVVILGSFFTVSESLRHIQDKRCCVDTVLMTDSF